MKYFQLIFMIFCVSAGTYDGRTALDPCEALKWQYRSVVERSRNLRYKDFEEKVGGDLQRFLTESSDSLQLKDPEKSVVQRLDGTRRRWIDLQAVCPNARHQGIILATAMEFLEQPEFQRGYFSGGEIFWTLQDYLSKPEVPNIFWDMEGKSIIALYYLMRRHPSVDRYSISREGLPQVEEDSPPLIGTFQAPSDDFVKRLTEARIEDLAQAVRALKIPHASFVQKFMEAGKGSLYHVTAKLSHSEPALNSTRKEPRGEPVFTRDPLVPQTYLVVPQTDLGDKEAHLDC